MKTILERILLGIVLFVIVIVGVALFMFRNELRSLMSIHKLDDYGMFEMTYYGDYGFDEFLKTGARSDSDIEDFVTKRLLKGLPINLNVSGAGCTAFVVPDENGDIIYGRNFDFSYAPSMKVITRPKNGYASVSMVNLSFAGYGEDKLPNGEIIDSFLTLASPFLPFDGMNEKGVSMALLAVPQAALKDNPDKVTLNTTTAIRLVLDKAASVEEAVALLEQYNIYFSGDVDCHFLIADAQGASVLVEYYDGNLVTVYPDTDYQIASNFIAYNGLNIGEGYTEFERYDEVEKTIQKNEGVLNEEQAAALLAKIGVKTDTEDKLQWTSIYNLTKRTGAVFAHRKIDKQHTFDLMSEK